MNFTRNVYEKRGRWHRLESPEGVSWESIHADSLGLIWTSGLNHLECFDGVHNHDVLPELGIAFEFRKTGFTNDHRWWGLTNKGGLISLDLLSRKVTDYTALMPDLGDAYWLWTSQYSSDIVLGVPDQLIRFDKNKAEVIDVQGDEVGKVNGLTISARGQIWFTTAAGLFRLDGEDMHFRSAADLGIKCLMWELLVTRDDAAWIVTSKGGLYKVEDDRVSVVSEPLGLNMRGSVIPIYEDHEGNVWLNNQARAIDCITGNGRVSFTTDNGIPALGCRAATQDLQKKMWFCSRASEKCFYDNVGMLSVMSGGAYSACRAGERSFFLAATAGIVCYDERDIRVVSDRADLTIYSRVVEGVSGRLIFYTVAALGLRELDINTGECTENEAFGSDYIFSAVVDGDGVLWVATFTDLCRVEGSGVIRIPYEELGIKNGRDLNFYLDAFGKIIVLGAMDKVVAKYDRKGFQTSGMLHPASLSQMFSSQEDNRLSRWYISDYGKLFCYDGTFLREIEPGLDLTNSKLNCVVKDNQGILWFGTSHGLYKYNGHVFQQLTSLTGLPDNYITGLNILSDGSMLISTLRGVCRYCPDYSTGPCVMISKVVTDASVIAPESVKMHTGIPSIRINYIGSSTKPGRLKYLYRLDGYDDVWHETWETSIRYEKLSAGDYFLQIKAVDVDFVDCEKTAVLPLRVGENPDKLEINSLKGALRSTKEFSDNVIRSIRDSIIVLDQSGVVTMANQASLNLLDYAQNDMVGMHVRDLLCVEDRDLFSEQGLGQILTRGAVKNQERNMLSGGGKRVPVLLSASVMYDDHGSIQGIVVFASDLTEYKELQQQLQRKQKMESLGVLAGGVAHDFNNLLSVIIGNAELVKSGLPSGSEGVACLSDVLQAARHAARLCSELLDYTGKAIIQEKEVDFTMVLKDLLHLMGASVSKKIRLESRLEPRLPMVYADETQLSQIVINLITNAAEAIGSDNGSITVTTRCASFEEMDLWSPYFQETPKAGEYVVLQVVDTGCGMDEKLMVRIFEPFFTSKFTGRGLGLAAVHGIVQAHRGTIHVKSTPGAGAAFTIYLPAHKAAVPLPVPELIQKPPAKDSGAAKLYSGNVLLVDDEAALLAIAERLLKYIGFSVIKAVDGVDAVEKFAKHKDDLCLVIMDMTMPRMDGKEAYEKIREISADIPFIMSSGYNEANLHQYFADDPAVLFLKKPYNLDQLAGVLNKAKRLK